MKGRSYVQILLLWPKGGSHMNTGFCQEARWLSPGYGPGRLVYSLNIAGTLSRWNQRGSYQNWNILDFIHGNSFTLYLHWTWSTCMVRPSVGHVPTSAWGTCPLSLPCPAADSRKPLLYCFLQPVLPSINEYMILISHSRFFFLKTHMLWPKENMINSRIQQGCAFCSCPAQSFCWQKNLPLFLTTDLDFLYKRVFSMSGKRGEGRQKPPMCFSTSGHPSRAWQPEHCFNPKLPMLSWGMWIHPHLVH